MNAMRQITQHKPQRRVASPEFGPDLDPQSCRFLWRSVLKLQWDLAFPPFEASRRDEIDMARRWFGSADFETVCALADVDPAAVLSSFRAVLSDTPQVDRPADRAAA